MKICKGCGELKNLDAFSRISRHSGLRESGFTYCNDCVDGELGEIDGSEEGS